MADDRVAVPTLRIDRLDQLRQRNVSPAGDFLQPVPECIFDTNTRFVARDYDTSPGDQRFHDNTPIGVVNRNIGTENLSRSEAAPRRILERCKNHTCRPFTCRNEVQYGWQRTLMLCFEALWWDYGVNTNE
jgi:hypothetical protein